jgi:hypothetical protein
MASIAPPVPLKVCTLCYRVCMMYAAGEVTRDIEETYERHLSGTHGITK